jgi:hypothetical protein
MIREDLLYLSKFVAINTLEDSSSARFDFVSRTSLTDTIVTVKPRSTVSSAALWLRLTRSDSTIQAYTSTDGSTWTFQGATTAPMTAQITAGLFVCGNEYSAGTFMAGFSNVSFTGTSAADNPFVLPVASHPFAQLTRNELRVSNMAPGRQKLLRLTDAGGRTVWSDRTSDTRYSAPLPRLSHGIYIFSIIGPGTNWSGPLIR